MIPAVTSTSAHSGSRTGRDCPGREGAAPHPGLKYGGQNFIVAADHPARGALAVGSNAVAMADRRGLLDRLQIALANPAVDGVLASPDVLDDLLLLGALDGKLVFAAP